MYYISNPHNMIYTVVFPQMVMDNPMQYLPFHSRDIDSDEEIQFNVVTYDNYNDDS